MGSGEGRRRGSVRGSEGVTRVRLGGVECVRLCVREES